MKNSVKRYIKVLMHAGIFISILSINSCSKDDNPLGMESGECYPLTIGSVSFFTGHVASQAGNPSENSMKTSTGLITSVSSISEYLEVSETDVLRSSENNLKNKGVGIFRLSGKGYPSAQNNIHYSYNYDENDWCPSDENNPVYLDKDEAKLCAYYP